MSTNPLVSICIPVYNGAAYIAETIASVQRQTYSNVEILVQDNQSTDRTLLIVHALAKGDPRILVAQNTKNLGMAGNWNACFARASGEFVQLLSADDLLKPTFTRACLEELVTDPKCIAVATDHLLLFNGQSKSRKVKLQTRTLSNFASLVLLLNPLSINFMILRRSYLESISPDLKVFGPYLTCDYGFHLDTALGGHTVRYLDQRLGIYRIHSANLSNSKGKMARQAALTVLSRKEALKKQCQVAFRFTLLRFMARALLGAIRGYVDVRLLKILWSQLWSR